MERLGISSTLRNEESNVIEAWGEDNGTRSQFQLMLDSDTTISGRIHPLGILDESVGVRLSSLVVVEGDDACEIDIDDLAPGEKETGAS